MEKWFMAKGEWVGLPAVAVGAASTTTTRLQYGEAYTGVMYFGAYGG